MGVVEVIGVSVIVAVLWAIFERSTVYQSWVVERLMLAFSFVIVCIIVVLAAAVLAIPLIWLQTR